MSYAWLLVSSTEGMCSGLTGVAQKKGSAEATSGGGKSVVDAVASLPV